MTISQLANQALVLFVDGGTVAADLMDKMEERYRETLQIAINEEQGLYDDTAIPDGMSLREMSMGVIPDA